MADYKLPYTASEVETKLSQIDTFSQEITDIKNQIENLTPEPVGSIEECIDTSKKYVLPDGYIYAYKQTACQEWENAITTSKAHEGNGIFNEIGYKNYVYLSSSNITPDTSTGNLEFFATGYIPYEYKDGKFPSIYIKGVKPSNADQTRLFFFRENGGVKNWEFGATIDGVAWPFCFKNIYAENTKLTKFFEFTQFEDTYWKLTPKEAFMSASSIGGSTIKIKDTIKYFRISLAGAGSEAVISIDKPIEDTYRFTWVNTGVSFTGTDYTDTIADLENRLISIENASINSNQGIPTYVTEEAVAVAKRVLSHQNANTISFLAISDAHYLAPGTHGFGGVYDNIHTSVLHAGQGMDIVRKNVHIDFAACLGDNGWGSGNAYYVTKLDEGIEELRSTNACIESAFRGIPNFRTPGNHCGLTGSLNVEQNGDYLTNSELYPLYGAYNTGAVYPDDERHRGYCHRDFPEHKLRVVLMNTSDDPTGDGTAYGDLLMSNEQMSWFKDIIDLSTNYSTDAVNWSVLILSHASLDSTIGIHCCAILDAYVQGKKISEIYSSTVSRSGDKDYSTLGTNKAKIVGNIHGHTHSFVRANLSRLTGKSFEYIYPTSASTSTKKTCYETQPIGIKRMCVPNACYLRFNDKAELDYAGNPIPDAGRDFDFGQYDTSGVPVGDSAPYKRVPGTATDTAFCIFTIDTAACKVYMNCYGAGGEDAEYEMTYGTYEIDEPPVRVTATNG